MARLGAAEANRLLLATAKIDPRTRAQVERLAKVFHWHR